jgi:uncharacterized HAD superfamily protein
MHSINTFIDKIKFLETKNAKEFSMTIREAKDLHADITRLLLVMQELTQNHNKSQEPIQVELRGDGF